MGIKELISFLNKLEDCNISHKLDKVRNDGVMVEVVVPGQRWEIEFIEDSSVEIEKSVRSIVTGFLGLNHVFFS